MCSIFKYSVSVGSTFTKSNSVSFKKLNWFAIDLNITLGFYNVLLIRSGPHTGLSQQDTLLFLW